ncbi:hypothetical protein TELCIR_08851, partial [Teladorsagia circumcincta]
IFRDSPVVLEIDGLMGCCVSSDRHQDFEQRRKRRQSSVGVGMGVAMMMQQAGAMVGAAPPAVDLSTINAQIRKAKAEGRTVTMVNGTLYFDYQLVARIPPHFDIQGELEMSADQFCLVPEFALLSQDPGSKAFDFLLTRSAKLLIEIYPYEINRRSVAAFNLKLGKALEKHNLNPRNLLPPLEKTTDTLVLTMPRRKNRYTRASNILPLK